MTRRSVVSIAALAWVLVLGVAPGAAHAKPADKPTAPSECEDVDTRGNKTFDCDY